MGCDIHTHVEYKNFKVDPWQSGDYFIKAGAGYIKVDFCEDRSYRLFAVLANVRNREGVEYISEPRGIPSDATEYTRECYKIWDIDAHSASYLTLKELIDFRKSHPDATVLDYLIDELKRRANELYLIYDFQWDRRYGEAYAKSDLIRIVFWFDN